MKEWFRKAGFRENPLDYSPLRSGKPVLNLRMEVDDILYRVRSGSIVLVEGPEGSGKTTLLKAVIDNFGGSGKVVYLDCSRLNKQLNISELLAGYHGFVRGRVLRRKPRGMILLLDNVQGLSRRNCERIKFYFDEGFILSVILATSSYDETEFSDSLIDRIVDTITLPAVDADRAVQVVQHRLGGRLLPEAVIRALWVRSSGMRRFFSACEGVAALVAEDGRAAASISDVAAVEIGDLPEDVSSFRCANCGLKLSRIGDVWRCEGCEQFCLSCGSLASDEDSYCPGCGLRFEE